MNYMKSNLKYVLGSVPLVLNFKDYKTVSDWTKCNYDVDALYSDTQYVSQLINSNPKLIDAFEKCSKSNKDSLKILVAKQLEEQSLEEFSKLSKIEDLINFMFDKSHDNFQQLLEPFELAIEMIFAKAPTTNIDLLDQLFRCFLIKPDLVSNKILTKYLNDLIGNLSDDDFIKGFERINYLLDNKTNLILRLKLILNQLDRLLSGADEKKFYVQSEIDQLSDPISINQYLNQCSNKYYYYLYPITILKYSTNSDAIQTLCDLKQISDFIIINLGGKYSFVNNEYLSHDKIFRPIHCSPHGHYGHHGHRWESRIIRYEEFKQDIRANRLRCLVLIALANSNLILAKQIIKSNPNLMNRLNSEVISKCSYEFLSNLLQILPNKKLLFGLGLLPCGLGTDACDYEKKQALIKTIIG